ncbi:uncharacterized protein LOC114528276 [Dendronephthya gigantea]|uniref:uncharacterized protein LOC114528276 n=1 Tax=Dendronephthya gigantea TaxID=151771 RepID=UPI00106DAAF3|nr:uncharacterized protein LOC114528276 [Dendronephthya gigantea]
MSFIYSIWPSIKLGKSWINSSLIVYILYFAVYILNRKYAVLSSAVCFTDRKGLCYCNNNNSAAVKCLLGGLNDSCLEGNATKSYKAFCEIMSQFDCRTKYSVKWKCKDCLEAYTKWLLAVFNPWPKNNTWLSKCTNSSTTTIVSSCREVLAKCPYFAPQNSYGDTPAFECPLNLKDYKSTNCKD